MAKISFKVSARTARLIGSDNIAHAEGALVELVKNSYDADSENTIIFFDNYWMKFLQEINIDEFNQFIKTVVDEKLKDEIKSWYLREDKSYIFQLTDKDKAFDKARKFYRSKCSLFIADNGEGMNDLTIVNYWMTIGTSNKLTNPYSNKKKRVKSGEKGIGRFALDRLGEKALLHTFEEKTSGYTWEVNWNDFEANETLDDITANLYTEEKLELKNRILELSKNHLKLQNTIDDIKFDNGTIIKIDNLKDDWTEENIDKLYNSLEVLIPPKETSSDHKIYVFTTLMPDGHGEIKSSTCEDYDYKLFVKLEKDGRLKYKITRRELNWREIDKDVFKEKGQVDMTKWPYDLDTLKKGGFEKTTSIEEIWPEYSESTLIDKIGPFDFTFYFMRKSTKDSEIHNLKTFTEQKRKDWLSRFGGIKIYRDNFKVRPYGEPSSNAYDWLGLGKRATANRYGVAQKSNYGWRVGPDQVFGVINISKLKNLGLEDLSNRGGLIENEAYFSFKDLIVKMIHLVEMDRHDIIRSIKIVEDRKDETQKSKEETLKWSEELLKETKREKSKLNNQDSSNQYANSKDEIHAKGIKKLSEELQEKENELKLLRGMASTGLTISTFAHELDDIGTKMDLKLDGLNRFLENNFSRDEARNLPSVENPFILIEAIGGLTKRMENWLNFSNNSIRKDRRKATDLNLEDYFNRLKTNWHELLQSRSSSLSFKSSFKGVAIKKTYAIDLDSIFNNLITNSLEAFYSGKSSVRNISIDYKIEDRGIMFYYSDSGPGLSSQIKKPNWIFESFNSTKNKDKGIGLGMWIIKATAEEYNGYVELVPNQPGFNIKIFFPKIKN